MKRKTLTRLLAPVCFLGFVASQWPAMEPESLIPAGRVESTNFLGERVKIIRTTNGGFFLIKYPP